MSGADARKEGRTKRTGVVRPVLSGYGWLEGKVQAAFEALSRAERERERGERGTRT